MKGRHTAAAVESLIVKTQGVKSQYVPFTRHCLHSLRQAASDEESQLELVHHHIATSQQVTSHSTQIEAEVCTTPPKTALLSAGNE
jgi:hypothetical protein